jgi:hypothetical protein
VISASYQACICAQLHPIHRSGPSIFDNSRVAGLQVMQPFHGVRRILSAVADCLSLVCGGPSSERDQPLGEGRGRSAYAS